MDDKRQERLRRAFEFVSQESSLFELMVVARAARHGCPAYRVEGYTGELFGVYLASTPEEARELDARSSGFVSLAEEETQLGCYGTTAREVTIESVCARLLERARELGRDVTGVDLVTLGMALDHTSAMRYGGSLVIKADDGDPERIWS